MTAESRQVWEQIAAAFPAVVPSEPITPCDCEECLDVRANLGNCRWNDILPATVEKCFGSLPLLTDEAFQALLPAFLFRALNGVSNKNQVLEFTLYTLCPSRAIKPRQRRRISRLTESQRESVRAFLRLMSTEPALQWHHDAIMYALSAYWA